MVYGDRFMTRRLYISFTRIAAAAAAMVIVGLPLAAWPCAGGSGEFQLWYEDNNMGRAGGSPPDFTSKFGRAGWLSASAAIDVYLVRATVLDRLDAGFLRGRLLPWLERQGISLAIDAAGATWLEHGNRRELFALEMRILRRLGDIGVPVRFISLQSVLSKPLPDGEYPLEERLGDIQEYVRAAREIHPGVSVGLIDAMPVHRGPWREAYSAVHGLDLIDYIHLDVPYERIGDSISPATIREVEAYVESRGMDFGILLTTRDGGYASNEAYARGVTASLATHLKNCATPAAYILASWFPYPDRTVPVVKDLLQKLDDYRSLGDQ